MTYKIQTFKEKPLLAPPSIELGRNWWDVSDVDRHIMNFYLGEHRRTHHGANIAELQHYMRKLGIAAKPTEKDKEAMREELDRLHGNEVKLTDVWRRFMIRDAGLDDAFKSHMAIALRAQHEAHMDSRPVGERIEELYFMKDLGIIDGLTDDEKIALREDLKTYRKNFEGIRIGEVHYYMRKFGMHEEVTEDDRHTMMRVLNSCRGEVLMDVELGADVAKMLIYSRELFGEEKSKGAQDMPPLKKIHT